MNKITIGKYTISYYIRYDGKECLKVRKEDGESAGFETSAIEALIEKYYNENF